MKYAHNKLFWGGIAITLTAGLAVMYLIVQQSLRYAANEPQKSMVIAAAAQLNDGVQPESITQGHIDMSSNMAPFVIVYDQFGKVVKGNGYIDNSIPQVPIGVLSAASKNKAHAVTWQPNDKVRIAAVSIKSDRYYVLGGRSLTTTEHQIDTVGKWIIAAWLVGVISLFMLYRVINRKPKTSKQEEV